MTTKQQYEQIKTLLDVAVMSKIDAKLTHEQASQIVSLYEQNEKLKEALITVANWDKATKEDVNNCIELLKELNND